MFVKIHEYIINLDNVNYIKIYSLPSKRYSLSFDIANRDLVFTHDIDYIDYAGVINNLNPIVDIGVLNVT